MPLKLKRNIRASFPTNRPAARDVSETSNTIEQSHARQILNLPDDQRQVVIKSMREGVKIGHIAAFFGEQGWLDVTEKSFKQYLMAFKRVYPDRLRNHENDSLDQHIDARQPDLDEEVVLQQLIRLQQARLGIGHSFEKRTTIINKDLAKEVEVTAGLVESLSAIRGGGKKAGRPGGRSSGPMSNEAGEALRKADVAEGQQDKMASLVSSLAPLLQRKLSAKV